MSETSDAEWRDTLRDILAMPGQENSSPDWREAAIEACAERRLWCLLPRAYHYLSQRRLRLNGTAGRQ